MGALAGVAVGRQRLETAEPGFNFRHRAFLPQADMHIGAEYLAMTKSGAAASASSMIATGSPR